MAGKEMKAHCSVRNIHLTEDTGLQRGGKKKHDTEKSACIFFPLLCSAHLNYNVLQARVENFVP